jgi:hypothetical protein
VGEDYKPAHSTESTKRLIGNLGYPRFKFLIFFLGISTP